MADEDKIRQQSLEYQKTYGQGQQQELEPGLEEGDITDYFMPLKGLGKKGLKSAISMMRKAMSGEAAEAATKQAAKRATPPTLDYSRLSKQGKSLREMAAESERKAPTLRYKTRQGRQDTSQAPEYIPPKK